MRRGWWRQARVRLALAYSGIFSVVTLVAALAMWLALDGIEVSAVDDGLRAQGRSAQAAITEGARPALTSPPTGGVADAGNSTTRVFDAGGSLLDGSTDGADAAVLAGLARRAGAGPTPVVETVRSDGTDYRAWAGRVTAASGAVTVVVVTRSLAETDRLLGTAAVLLLLGVVVLVVAATVLGYGLAGTALRPVREIAATARGFSQDDLHRRLELDLPDDELGELAATFNAMLARLDGAFDGLRRFTADAAHELRAPLALIRTEAEVSLAQQRSGADYRRSLETILAEAERMSRLADQLLLLARADAGALVAGATEVDIGAIATSAAELWHPLAAERGVGVVAAGPGDARVRGDEDLLRRLIDNLVDNALRHATRGSAVEVNWGAEDRAWELTVTDRGPGVPAAARATIFDRFSRADPSRGRSTGGAGLGLALCRAIAEVHGGSIRLDEAYTAGARFVVRLPVTRS